MIRLLFLIEGASMWLVLATAVVLIVMIAAILAERIALARIVAGQRRFEHQYAPVVARALSGDEEARRVLAALPQRSRIAAARLVIQPLVNDRDPAHVAAARDVTHAMQILPLAQAYLHSAWWWRRVLALRVFGLIQDPGHADDIVAALDDRHGDVRGAALDAIADLQDPSLLPALLGRIEDTSLHVGRRAAAIAAFGAQCEPFLLQIAAADPGRRWTCAKVLATCGTARARPALCEWAVDRRADVRIAALEALGHVGLDQRSSVVVLAALESRMPSERAMAAAALRGWAGDADVSGHLARHMDDTWTVALQAARSLQSIPGAGHTALEVSAARPGLAGLLARQMLWEAQARC